MIKSHAHRILLIMRLIIVILIASLMQVSASGFAQRISLNERKASLEVVLEKIRAQSGYDLICELKTLSSAKPVNVSISNVSIQEALKSVLKGQPLTYDIDGKIIVIKPKSLIDRISDAFIKQDIIRGKVLDEEGQPIVGATITEKGTENRTVTNKTGDFSLKSLNSNPILLISYIGYTPTEFKTINGQTDFITIVLIRSVNKLEEVNVVSTGYQTLPKERSTGSFDKMDNKLFNRNTSSDIISRMEGLTSGLTFDKRKTSAATLSGLSIRGRSTLFANTAPLVVIDNFPYDGDINNINPNDVESVTFLKDAAAASIWGVRAGNGVIVITTKKGKLEQPLKVSVNSNITIEEKPDLMKIPTISTSGFIDVEKMLYEKGFYNSDINNNRSYPLLSPVVELLIQNTPDSKNAIDALRNNDVRQDFTRYIYRQPIRQQYAINLSRGYKTLSYLLSAGYDNNTGNILNNKQDRLSLRAFTSFIPIKNLELQTNILYTQNGQNRIGNNSNIAYGVIRSSATKNLFPYMRLVDDQGNPINISKDYRNSFIRANSSVGLLDWTYNPIAEINDSYNKSKSQDLLLNFNASYKINPIFSGDLKYQYEKTNSTGDNFQGLGTYYTRDLINRYTQINGDQIINNIPMGGILNKSDGNFDSHNVRGQLNANKTWAEKHALTAIAGVELKQNRSKGNSYITYGYDPNLLTFQNVDYVNEYPIYKGLTSDRAIPNEASFTETINRYTSIYANAAYTYDTRYTATASARKDASNIFGVDANQKGVPLWSSGISWNISNEKFYNIKWLPYLKMRGTYGYNGNLRNDLSAFTVIRNMPSNPVTNTPYADILSPPNPDLIWEKIGIANFGIDFGSKNNRLSGSVEYYKKSAKDLIGLTPIESTTGVRSVTRNSANLRGEGVDLTLNSVNKIGPITWSSTFIYSYTQNKVTKYLQKSTTGSSYITSGSFSGINPIEGKPVYAIYAFKWAGLDPLTGDPQGYLNGVVSKDYNALRAVKVDDLEYIGSAVPNTFGAFRNTFAFSNFSISANITYKFDYYFRRQALSYGTLYTNGIGTSDFDKRWLKPGDEKNTNVPSMIYPNSSRRDDFYAKSAALVEKGDHIRLQDITLNYILNRPQWTIKNVRLFFNVNNVGILWRSNKLGIDPDYDSNSYPASKTFSFGLNADF